MTVTTTYPNLVPLASYPGTEAAWRDTRARELVPATVQAQGYARESQVGSDKDRYRSQEGRGGTTAALASDTTVTLTEEAIQRQSGDASSQEQQGQGQSASDQDSDAQTRAGQGDSPARSAGEPLSGKQDNAATDNAGQKGSVDQKDSTDQNDIGQKDTGQKDTSQKDSAGQSLSTDEKQAIEELDTRDEEVRQHERDHQVTGGRYAQAPTFELSRGPDGKSYATGGEVRIDLSRESTPQATIQKMQQIERAALAPQEPSTQDRRVAARAAQIADEARADELRQQQTPSAEQQRLSEKAPAAETLIRSINDPRQDDQAPVMSLRNQAISRRYAQSWQTAQSAGVSRYA